MPGLLDVAKSTAEVTLSTGAKVTTPGVSAKGIASLLQRFPIAREMLSGKSRDIGFDELLTLAPDAVAAFIAAGTGAPGSAKDEEIAASLPVEDQIALCEGIFKSTMPNGLQSFLERLQAARAAIPESAELTSIQDTKSPPGSSS